MRASGDGGWTIGASTDLEERLLHNRAVEAVEWRMPGVNYLRMFDAARKAGADFNQIVYWSRLFLQPVRGKGSWH